MASRSVWNTSNNKLTFIPLKLAQLEIFRPAVQTLPFPIRTYSLPLTFKWYGLSEGRTTVEFELGYSAVQFNNRLPKYGFGEEGSE